MWIEQGFIVGELGRWVNSEGVLATKFVSVIDGREMVIHFAEKESQVMREGSRS
jgi:hypothetical protein